MEQVSKLLQQLAEKLGTTVQYLWHVMVKEAFVNGISNLIVYGIVTVAGIIIYRIHKRLMNDKNKICYDDFDGLVAVMIIVLVAWIIVLIVCIVNIGDTVNSFFNPEYWALHEILHKV